MIMEENIFSKLPYWEKLNERQKRFLSENAAVRRYAKGEIVHGYGSACLGSALVLKGCVRIYLLSEEGREITLFRLEAGEPCVLSASCIIRQITFDTHMVVEKDCELLVVNSVAFDRLAEENIYVKCFMYELATERFSSVMQVMQQILFSKFERRLASFLLKEFEGSGKRELRMTHAQIAAQISSAREVVARTLKKFEGNGWVELKRGRVLLKDVEQLQKI